MALKNLVEELTIPQIGIGKSNDAAISPLYKILLFF
jgi:hypothetical protein